MYAKQETRRVKSTCHLFLAGFLIYLLFSPEDRQYLPLKHQQNTTGLHDDTSQKTVLFTVITVIISTPTKTAYSLHILFQWINKETS